MKCNVINLIMTNAAPEAVIEHQGEELHFSVSCFGRQNFLQDFDVFSQMNSYWSTLTEDAQQKIFQTYKEINNLYLSLMDRKELTIQLNHRVAELLAQHDFESIHHWLLFHPNSDIIVPENFDKEYVHSIDKQGSREQTYIRSDYTKLVALSLILRTMIPIWGEFINRTRSESGTSFKEYHAFALLNSSVLLHAEPFDKLRMYIDYTIGEDRSNPNTIMSRISSEDFPIWMLSMVSIRRLCLGDIRGTNPKANLVSCIYKFIMNKMKGTDTTAENMVKSKTYEDGRGDKEAKISALERYKVKHNVSIGEIAELEFSVRDIQSVAYRLSINMTDALLNDCLKTAQQLKGQRILDPQMTLLRWILKPVISPRGVMYLNEDTIVKCFGVVQAVLWARGYKYLSLLVTSHANLSDDEMFISTVDSRARIPKEVSSELDRLYPYYEITGGKKSGQKNVNLAIKSVETLADNLSMFSWRMTASKELIADALGNANSVRLPVPYDIKIQLAKLVIELGSRTWN